MAVDVTVAGAGGEYMETVTIVEWRAAVGDTVDEGAPIAVVETAKAATDIEAPAAGTLTHILKEVGDDVAVGEVIARISDGTADTAPPHEPPSPAQTTTPLVALQPRRPAGGRVVASPLARRTAKDLGVPLDGLKGTGPGGRIKRRDVLAAAPRRTAGEPVGPEPLILLHGFGADNLVWPPLLLHLDGVTPAPFALPGHGESGAAITPPSLEGLAEDVIETLTREGATDGHVVAHSLGGAVALELAALGAMSMRSLTLIAPAGLGPHINGPFLNGFTQADSVEGLTPWLRLLFSAEGSVPEGFARALHRRRPEPVRAAQRALARALFANGTQIFGRRRVFDTLAFPVRVIWGLEDQIIPQSHGDGLPGHVAVHRLKGVGHLPHIEAPATVARIVGETIRSAS